MASVQQIKDELRVDQERAVDLAEQSLSAMDALLNLSMFLLGGIGVIIALFALIGIPLLGRAARKRAEQVANKHVRDYIKGTAFSDKLEQAIADSVEDRWQSTVVLKGLQDTGVNEAGNDSGPAFQEVRKGGKDDS